ncbi:MAG: hypothetical protein ACOX9B_02805 [Candidatus Xenobium sp.]|jgi:hypothetical protein|nr:hypothetical protein [Burkholderiales bacterium]
MSSAWSSCAAHHLRHLHGGTMLVKGAGTRIWESGLQDGEPRRMWCDERLVDGEALAWEKGDVAESPPATAGSTRPRPSTGVDQPP